MAFCSNCGAQLKPEQRFCVQCGKPSNNPTSTTSQHQTNHGPSVAPTFVQQPQVDVAGLQARLTLSARELSEAKAEMDTLKNKLEDKSRQYTIAANELNELRKQVNSLNQELANSKEQYDKSVGNQNEDLKRKLESLETLLVDQKKEIGTQKLTIDNLSLQLSKANAMQSAPIEAAKPASNSGSIEKTRSSARLGFRLLGVLLVLVAFGIGGWFYYDNFLNGAKKLAAAEEAFLLNDWAEGLLQINKAEDIDIDMVFSLTNPERLYLDSLTKFVRAAKGDVGFIRETFENGGIAKIGSLKFVIGKIEGWPPVPQTQQFSYFQNTTGRLVGPLIDIADSVYLAALDLFLESNRSIVSKNDDYYIDDATLGYSAGDLVGSIKAENNKKLAEKKWERIKAMAKSANPKTNVPEVLDNTENEASKPLPKQPTQPPAPAASALPTVAEIKNDLIGKSISDWHFSGLNEFQSFKVVSQKSMGSSILYNIEAIIKDAGGESYKARFDVYYGKNGQGDWKFSKVVQTYFDYQ